MWKAFQRYRALDPEAQSLFWRAARLLAVNRCVPASPRHFLPLDGVRGKFAGEKRPLGRICVFAERSQQTNVPRIDEYNRGKRCSNWGKT